MTRLVCRPSQGTALLDRHEDSFSWSRSGRCMCVIDEALAER